MHGPWIVVAWLLPCLLWSCGESSGDGDRGAIATETTAATPPRGGRALFTEVTAALGLPAQAEPLPDGTYALNEIMGPGVALFDADGDGRLDLLMTAAPPPGRPDAPSPNRFYHQRADGTFEDRTAASGLGDPGAGQGVAIGDYDGDGDEDVFFGNFGPDALYRNDGDGTFTDVTAAAGVGHPSWTVSAAFLDYDRDGDLDLFAAHYLRFDPRKRCVWTDTRPEYCSPAEFEAAADTLYRNDGDGTFTDVSLAAGIHAPGYGLGVLCLDLTGDGWVDVFVANDNQDNHLWVNRSDGTFAEEALLRGVAVNQQGEPEASMGLAAGDCDGDGNLDLFLTHLEGQTNTLYSPQSPGLYDDRSARTRLGRFDRAFTSFGCGFLDFDHDGDVDLAIANGRVRRGPVDPTATLGSFWNDYAETSLLMQNAGDGTFDDVSASAGTFGALAEIRRGLALGDLDRDGDVDLVVTGLGSPLRVYRNEAAPADRHWLRVLPITGARPALGAVVQVEAGAGTRVAPCLAASSYASSSEPIAHFGLGASATVDRVTVTWPDGTREEFAGGPADRTLRLVQGEGAVR